MRRFHRWRSALRESHISCFATRASAEGSRRFRRQRGGPRRLNAGPSGRRVLAAGRARRVSPPAFAALPCAGGVVGAGSGRECRGRPRAGPAVGRAVRRCCRPRARCAGGCQHRLGWAAAGCAQLVVSLGDPIAAAPVRAEGSGWRSSWWRWPIARVRCRARRRLATSAPPTAGAAWRRLCCAGAARSASPRRRRSSRCWSG